MDPIDQESLSEYYDFAYSLAKKAGAVVKQAYYLEKSIETKSCVTDLVTETDKKVEDIILEGIRSTYPDHEFIGEESVAAGRKCVLTDSPTWIVDPIDGTTNFVHQFPYSAVCIGLVVKRQTVIGIVYNPILEEMFSAKRGHGAFLNGEKLCVSKQEDLSQSLVLTECGSSRNLQHIDKVFANMHAVLTAPVHAIHSLGSAALNICMVARGSAEVYYEFGIHCWDYCAAGLILEESGGTLIDTAGGPLDLMRRRLIAANNIKIANSLSQVLKEQIELPRD